MRAEVDSVLYAVSREDLLVTDAIEALRLVSGIRSQLDEAEVQLIEILKDAGLTWDLVGDVLWGVCRQMAQKRYSRMGGTRKWPPGHRGMR